MSFRRAFRVLATLAVAVVLLPIAVNLVAAYADQNGYFDDPTPLMQHLQRIAIVLTAILYSWWYPWVAGYVVGFGFGVWTESMARGRSLKSFPLEPDGAFDFPHFEELVARAKEQVGCDINQNGLGREPRISMDAANEVLAVMLYLARFGIGTPMRGGYSHTLIQIFLVRSMHYLSLVEPAAKARDLRAIRNLQDAPLVDRQSQLIGVADFGQTLDEAALRLVNS